MTPPELPLHELLSGELSLRFLPVELLHRGSRSVVVRAESRSGGEGVVVKLPADGPTPIAHQARVQWEYSVLRALRGTPGVVEALDLVPHGTTFALVLRPAPGGPARPEAMGLRAALSLGAQLSETLARVHAAGVVHGDVKPQNLLWGEAGLTLLDFETARYRPGKARGADACAGGAGGAWGTPAYMAPEQGAGTGYPLDERADLYAVGVTLYELLAGRPPFVGGDVGELIHRHLGERPPRLRDVAPAVPAVVSDLVSTLLEKDPAHRYQTAAGLAGDLRRCLDSLTEGGAVRPFRLRSRDFPGRLAEVTQLVGRQHELDALEKAAFRARRGARELVLVGGDSGSGKSMLLTALRGALSNTSTLVLEGKFEQLVRGTPYLAFRQALRALSQTILAEPNEGVLRWKGELERALGPNVSVVTDLCPELSLLFDAPPRGGDVGPSEAAPRFRHTMRQFWRTVATEAHPVVLLLDDLQWADAASWQLVSTLLSTPELTHFLVVGAYRTDDPGLPAHRVRELAGPPSSPRPSLRLGPLAAAEATSLVRRALDTAQDNLGELVSLLVDKTGGNPYFLLQFLGEIHRQGRLERSTATGEWSWRLEALRSMRTAPSVAPLLASRVAALGDEPRRLLSVASCLGHSFDARALSLASGEGRGRVEASLERLAGLGLLERDEGEGLWRFAHDTIEQAAYRLADPDESRQLHLAIARRLDEDPSYAEAALEQWNHAAELISDPAVQLALALRNLRAAEAAARSLALEAALGYADHALALLEQASEADALSAREGAEALRAELLFRLGEVEAAEAVFDALLERAAGGEPRARLFLRLSRLRGSLGNFALSYSTALEGLRELGVFPPDELPSGPGLPQVDELLGRGEPEANAPGEGPGGEALDLELELVAWLSCLYSQRSALTAWWSFQLALGSARRPGWRGRGVALASIGLMLSGNTETAETGFLLATEGFRADREAACLPQAALVYAPVAYFVEGEAAGHAMVLEAIRQAVAGGDLTAAMFSSLMPPVFSAGRSPARTLEALWAAVPELRDGPTADLVRLLDPLVKAESMAEADAYLRRAALRQRGSESEALAAACVLAPYAIAGGDGEALSLLFSYIADYQPKVLLITLTELWGAAFVLLGQIERGASDELLARLDATVERFAAWVEKIHRSYAPRLLLLRAEQARWRGQLGEAMRLYEEAIGGALAAGHTFDLALALERAARFYLSRSATRAARQYLVDAIRAYEAWGFRAKTGQLFERHAGLLGGLTVPPPPAARPPAPPSPASPSAFLSPASSPASSPADAAATITGELPLGRSSPSR